MISMFRAGLSEELTFEKSSKLSEEGPIQVSRRRTFQRQVQRLRGDSVRPRPKSP